MNKKDLFIWIILITLTLVGYFSSTGNISKTLLVVSLLAVTMVKFMGVGFQFMELKKAHLFWKVTFVSLFLLFAVLVMTFGL